MLGKPSWFGRRKYTGWGFTPKTWQGWVYIIIIFIPIITISSIPMLGKTGTIFLIIWAAIFCLDFIHIMINLEMDEREKIHEAIAERNALWVIITILALGIAFQVAKGIIANTVAAIDPVILSALGGGIIAKIISNVYLDRKD